MTKKILLSLTASAVITTSLMAETITGSSYTGFESSARGGVSTTVPSASSMFNNPATLNSGKYFAEAALNGNVSYRENGLLGNLNDLEKLDIDNVFSNIESNFLGSNTAQDRESIVKALDIVKGMDGNSVNVNAGASFGVTVANWGIGYNTQATAVGKMVVDQNRTELIFDDGAGNYALYDPLTDTYSVSNLTDYQNKSLEYGINNGYSYANIKYHLLTEIPVSYSKDMSEFKGLDGLTLGGSVKYMQLETNSKNIRVNSSDNEVTDNNDGNKSKDSTFGVDLGAIYTLSNYGTTFGATAKNLNSPTFNNGGEEYKIKPSLKVGVSQGFFDNDLKIALDADLTKNKSTFSGTEDQYIGVGLSYEPTSWVSLNGGVKKNISSWAKETDNSGLIYSAGLSFGFKWVQVGLSGEMSSDSIEVDGSSIPKYASVNVGIIGKFGDSDNQAQRLKNLEASSK